MVFKQIHHNIFRYIHGDKLADGIFEGICQELGNVSIIIEKHFQDMQTLEELKNEPTLEETMERVAGELLKEIGEEGFKNE